VSNDGTATDQWNPSTNWTHLVELSLHSSPFTFIDSEATNSPARFYRALAS